MSTRLCLIPLLLCGSLGAQVAIVNSASFRSDQGVAPGTWAAAFGTFTGVPTTTAGGFPLPKTLGGVKVTVDGVDAPLYDVRPSQLTFLIPYATAPGLRPVQVTLPSGTVSGSVRVMTTSPGIFQKDAQSPPKGAIANQDATENSASAPAKRGEVIVIYATGPGALTTQVEDGAAPGASPLAATKSIPQVFIGGVEAQVQFSGLNPSAPGLWQINAVVPSQPFLSGKLALRVFMDGVDSNEVAVFVQ